MRREVMIYRLLLLAWVGTLISPGSEIRAEPAPGDVFREYTWWNETGDAGGALRVGGKRGQEHPDRGWAHGYVNAPVVLDHDFE